jgi:hypothetical protein
MPAIDQIRARSRPAGPRPISAGAGERQAAPAPQRVADRLRRDALAVRPGGDALADRVRRSPG